MCISMMRPSEIVMAFFEGGCLEGEPDSSVEVDLGLSAPAPEA